MMDKDEIDVGVSFFGETYVLTVATAAVEGEEELAIAIRASKAFEKETGFAIIDVADHYAINALPVE